MAAIDIQKRGALRIYSWKRAKPKDARSVNSELLADIPLKSGKLEAMRVGSDLRLTADNFSATVPEEHLPLLYGVVGLACEGQTKKTIDWQEFKRQKRSDVLEALDNLRESCSLKETDLAGIETILGNVGILIHLCAMAARTGCRIDDTLLIDCHLAELEAIREAWHFLKSVAEPTPPVLPQ